MRTEKLIKNIVLLSALEVLAFQTSANAQSFDLWIKSFIPNSHPSNPGYIRPVPKSNGKTMIPGPNIPYTNVQLVGSCYNTNNRGFSSDPKAESKITTEISFDLSPSGQLKNVSVKPPVFHPTEEYNCQTGAITCQKTTSGDTITVAQPVLQGKKINIFFDAAAHNPCVGAPNAITPNIKYKGNIVIDIDAGTIGFEGTVAKFPSYESYVIIDNLPPQQIFAEDPANGSTAWSLLFNKTVSKNISYQSLVGTWISTDPAGRFQITIDKGQCSWKELGTETGLSLQRNVPCPDLKQKSFRIERSNDAEALKVIGIDPSTASSVLQRNPKASFIDFNQSNNSSMIGDWNGIVITKDRSGKLDQIRQPGQASSKQYTFRRL